MDTDFPWERLTGEPLVYASMGTLKNGLAKAAVISVPTVPSSAVDGLLQRRALNTAVSRAAPAREALISLPSRSCSLTR